MSLYQIFNNETNAIQKNTIIDALLKYPNLTKKTLTYRYIYKRINQDEWCGIVGDELINSCKNMTKTERLNYYDENNLVDISFEEIEDAWKKVNL